MEYYLAIGIVCGENSLIWDNKVRLKICVLKFNSSHLLTSWIRDGFIFLILIYLAAPGLHQQHIGSLVVTCGCLLVACGIELLDQGSDADPCMGSSLGAQSLSHWATREVPGMALLFIMLFVSAFINKLIYHKEGWAPKNWCFPIVVLEKTLESSWNARRSNQSILKGINPEYSLEGLMLKLWYFGHLN